MKTFKTTIAGLALFALTSAIPARGADLAIKAPPTPYPLACPFCGIYAGVHGGYGWDLGSGTAGFATPMDFATAPEGFVGGAHVGYGYMLANPFYLGLEADGDFATLDGTRNNPGFVGNVHSKNRWLASVRARAGIVIDRTLVYGTFGWGWGSSEFTISGTDADGAPLSSSLSATLNGFTFGGGFEFAIPNSNWTARAELLRYNFNDLNSSLFSGALPIVVKDRVDVARGGLTYRF